MDDKIYNLSLKLIKTTINNCRHLTLMYNILYIVTLRTTKQ